MRGSMLSEARVQERYKFNSRLLLRQRVEAGGFPKADGITRHARFWYSSTLDKYDRAKKVAASPLLTEKIHTTKCEHCQEPYIRKKATGKYCSPKCRVAAHRAKQQAEA